MRKSLKERDGHIRGWYSDNRIRASDKTRVVSFVRDVTSAQPPQQ